MLHRQRGVTLIEVLGALGVLALLMLGLMQYMARSAEDVKAQQAAQQHRILAQAVHEWMQNPLNREEVLTGTTPASQRRLLPAIDLAPYLPPNFQPANSYMQTACVKVFHDSVQQQIIALTIFEGGSAIDDATLGYVVGHAGRGAGAVYSTNPAVARGSYQGWELPAAVFRTAAPCGLLATAGRLVGLQAYDTSGTAFLGGAGEWLARNEIPNRPELNRMNVELDMNSRNIDRILNAHIERSAFIGDNVFAGDDVYAGRDIVATRNVQATENLVAGENMVSVQGDIVALDGWVVAVGPDGKVITKDTVLQGMQTSYGATPKGSEGIYYSAITRHNSMPAVAEPVCPDGKIPQIFVAPASVMAPGDPAPLIYGVHAYAPGWVPTLLVLVPNEDDPAMGEWVFAHPESTVFVATKCT